MFSSKYIILFLGLSCITEDNFRQTVQIMYNNNNNNASTNVQIQNLILGLYHKVLQQNSCDTI